jgi:hypothetical protein
MMNPRDRAYAQAAAAAMEDDEIDALCTSLLARDSCTATSKRWGAPSLSPGPAAVLIVLIGN